ncbi:MAG TPA: MFS transporter, partial [Phycisphaerae bacterium]|nr:MFS transporter [Phycisphaerae bacterium]
DGSFLSLTACIGLLAGAGTGFCYVCPLAACVRWFPSHKGLVTGLAVAGFGGGAVLLASWADALLARGLDVLAVFRWIGLTYGAAILAAACALSVPARRFGGARRRGPTAAALFRDRVFWALALGMFAGTFAGLLVVGNLKPMAAAAGVAPWWAALAIGAFAVGNATGRITWGFLADRLGSRAIPLSLAFLVAATLCLLGVRRWDLAFAGGAMLVGFGFGACFVVYAAHVASRYGPDRVGTVYPPVFLAYGLAGIVGPAAGGFLLDLTGTPLAGLVLSAAVAAVGATAARRLLRPSAGAVRLWSAGAAVRPS